MDSIVFGYITNIIIAISVVGVILIVKNIPNLKNINKEEFKISKDCKYLLTNYTFLMSIILLIVMFTATQKMLM